MKKLVLALLLCVGCASMKPPAHDPSLGARTASPEKCDSYDSMHSIWGGFAAGTGLMAGSGGLATIQTEDKDVKLGLAVGSVVLGGTAALSAYLSSRASENYNKHCVEALPGAK